MAPALVKQFNQQVLANLELPAEVRPREVREHSVTVGPYSGPDWDCCGSLIEQMCEWLNGPAFSGDGAMRIPVAIIEASLAHLYLAWVHPFGTATVARPGSASSWCSSPLVFPPALPT